MNLIFTVMAAVQRSPNWGTPSGITAPIYFYIRGLLIVGDARHSFRFSVRSPQLIGHYITRIHALVDRCDDALFRRSDKLTK